MNEKKTLIFSSGLVMQGKSRLFWEDALKNVTTVSYANTLNRTLQNIKSQAFHLLIIFDNKPVISTWIRSIRKQSDIPIMVVEDTMQDQEEFIMAGADSVILADTPKKGIMLQAYALIRRYSLLHKASPKEEIKDVSLGLFMNQTYRRVMWNGKELKLTTKEFNFLSLLSSSPDQVYTLEQIYLHVWKDYPEGDIANMIYCMVRRVKRKLHAIDEKATDIIRNVREVGYYFHFDDNG